MSNANEASFPALTGVPQMRQRLAASVILGAVAGLYFWYTSAQPGNAVGDFDIHWIAARALWAGADPYEAAAGAGWAWPYYYPATTPVITLLIAWLPSIVARAVFVTISAGLLGFVMTRHRWWGLLIFLTPSYAHAYFHVQWTPLLVGAMLAPAAGWLLVAKPSIGLAYFISRPTLKAAIGCSFLLAISLVVRPGWPSEWLSILPDAEHIVAPVTRPGGFLLLLCAYHWRRADARLVLALACVPHVTLLYETLPLFTVARTFRQMATLVIFSVVGVILISHLVPQGLSDIARNARQWPYLLTLFYLPALSVVLLNGRNGVDAGVDRCSGGRLCEA